VCARCGARFGCAPVDGIAGPCWCTRLPAVVQVPGKDAGEGCWCPECLRSHIVSTTVVADTPRS